LGLFQTDPEVLASTRPIELREELDTNGQELDDPLDRHSECFQTDPKRKYMHASITN